MPHTASEITAVLDLEQVDDHTFLGRHQPSTNLAKVYGGQLFAQGLVAAARTVDPDKRPHAVQALFLEAGDHDLPVQYVVGLGRDGRSFSNRSVRGYQGERAVVHLTASFHVPEPGLEHQSEMPTTAAPGDLPELTEVMERSSSLPHQPWREEWAGLEVRYAPEHLEGVRGRAPGRQQAWMRTRAPLPDDPQLHRHVVAYLSDHLLLAASLVPHGILLGDPELPRATLNHSVWFHSDARADEWLLVDQRSPWAGGGRGLSMASVYTEDGRLVASLAQEGLIRPGGGLRSRLGMP